MTFFIKIRFKVDLNKKKTSLKKQAGLKSIYKLFYALLSDEAQAQTAKQKPILFKTSAML